VHYGVNTGELLGSMAAAGADVIGVDWRTRLDDARARLPAGVGVQGNLDPAAVVAGWPACQAKADAVLAANGGRAGHVFNLGHGVLPETDPGVLTELVGYVHERTRR